MAKNLSAVIITGRFGRVQKSPKATLAFGEGTVLGRTLKAYGANFESIVLVLTEPRAEFGSALDGLDARVKIVETPGVEAGIGTQLRVGVEALPSSSGGFALGLLDQPLLDESLVKELVQKFGAAKKKIVVPVCQGTIGLPAFFDASLSAAFKKLQEHDTAWDILKANGDEVEDHHYFHTSLIRHIDDVDDYHSLLRTAGLPVPEDEDEDDEMAQRATSNGAASAAGTSPTGDA